MGTHRRERRHKLKRLMKQGGSKQRRRAITRDEQAEANRAAKDARKDADRKRQQGVLLEPAVIWFERDGL